MRRILLIISMLVIPPAAPSRAAESPFNVDADFGWGGCYRPMEWTPVKIQINHSFTEPFAGAVTVSAPQDGLNTMNVSHTFVLTPDMPLHLPLVTKLAFAAEKCTVRIADQKGKTRWRHDYELWDYSPTSRRLTPVNRNDLLIGVLGRRAFGLLDVPRQSVCDSQAGTGQVYLQSKLAQSVPWDWTGFASLDLLIMYNPRWNEYRQSQSEAIARWVSNGGRFLLVLGSNPLPVDNPIAQILPFDVQPPRQTTVTTETLSNLRLYPETSEDVSACELTPKPGAHLYEIDRGNQGFFATAFVGFGRVGVLAFDPDTMTQRQRTRAGRFWVERIKAVLEDPHSPFAAPQQPQVIAEAQPTRCPLTGDLTHPDRHEGGIRLTIGGLAAGEYMMTSYHNNPTRKHSRIDIYINGELRARDKRQSRISRDNDAATFSTMLTVSDGNDVVIEYRPGSSSGDRRATLCGFELTQTEAVEGPDSPGLLREREPFLAVDIGASGQTVADGFIGLGFTENGRLKTARFTEADGLSAGITVTLEPTNENDKLQFNPTPTDYIRTPIMPHENVRAAPVSFASRTIRFAPDSQAAADHRDYHMYNISRAQAGSNAVMEYLYSIAQMRPLSIWWVVFLLTVLAILLGPVDYKILKSRDRLPLTWVTSSFWIVVFTVGAYYGVQALRGGKMQCRVVSVLDGICRPGGASDCAWSTNYCGLFAPVSDDYKLKDLGDRQWWSAIAPAQDHIYARHGQPGTRNVYCIQHDGSSVPHSLPINIWTMQCLLNESPLEQMPFNAQVRQEDGKVSVKITNHSDSPIRKGCVLFHQDRGLEFDNVGAGATKEFSGRLSPYEGWDVGLEFYPDGRFFYRSGADYHDGHVQFRNETAYSAQGSLQRTQTMKAFLARGGAVVCAEFDGAAAPFGVKGRSCQYSHIQLVRLVVFPENHD